MKITKLENNNALLIALKSNSTVYMQNGIFHRGNGLPAVITPYSQEYFYRGVRITKEIAEGKCSAKEILALQNMEIRQRAMEILGYEEFLNIFRPIDEFTPSQFVNRFLQENMYVLYVYDEPAEEPIKILQMYDPSKIPFVKYFIRVKPGETNCKEAVAHSYHLKSYEDFMFCKNWV